MGTTNPLNRRQFATAAAATAASSLFGFRHLRAAPVSSLADTPVAPAINPPDGEFLAGLPRLMEVSNVPGVGMAVVQEGRLVWKHAAGVMDVSTGQPIAEETLFPAASLGKPVFACAALRLADDGRLDLDRPLRAWVPDHAPADPRGDSVTARHVLSHSSGYRNWRNTADQALVPDFEPGARFQYSGEGFYYLQRVVEKLTGLGFQRFMEERFFGPLGMRASTYSWRADTAARVVTGHNRGNPVRPPSRDFAARLLQHAEAAGKPLAAFTHEEIVAAMGVLRPAPPALPNFIIPNAAGSLLTTVGDYALFLTAVLEPAPHAAMPAPDTRQRMFSPHTRVNSVLSWGLGWGIESDRGREYVWHWGDNGSFKNFVLVHVPTRSGIVVFTNGSNGLRVCEHVMAAATGHEHLAFDWL